MRRVVLSNFRSIGTRLEVPLDASTILIHGSNGAGKTSIISAIELALTGEIRSLKDVSPDYSTFLAHHGNRGFVELDVDGCGKNRIDVDAQGIHGAGMFDAKDARFYSERVYLAQSLLSRLLDVYEGADRKSDSPLTRFVNDLLGLDALDALIAGLDAAGHIRRLEKLVPELAGARKTLADLQSEIAKLEAERKAAVSLAEQGIEVDLTPVSETFDLTLGNWALLPRTQLDQIQIELSAITSRLEVLKVAAPSQLEELSAENEASIRAIEEWEAEKLPIAAAALAVAKPWLEVDAIPTVGNVAVLVTSAIDQLERSISEMEARKQSAKELQNAMAEIQMQLANIDAQLFEVSALLLGVPDAPKASELTSLLSELAHHLDGDVCPVCLRNFAEVSNVSLTDSLNRRVAEYEASVRTRAELNGERRQVEDRRSTLSQAYELMTARLQAYENPESPDTEARAALSKLRDLLPLIEDASELEQRARLARSAFATASSESRELVALNHRFDNVFDQIVDPRKESGDSGLRQRVLHLDALLGQAMVALDQTERARRLEARRTAEIATANARIAEQKQRLDGLNSLATRTKKALSAAESRMMAARNVAKAAVETRSSIVNRVFNDSLNRTWRDLFTRLAPDENYVPSFRPAPDALKRLLAQLVTTDLSGNTAGGPAVMLSAGNLNTAALSLFLSLHLTANPRIPWLVLDDPVQSMDDVHVSQFAAMTRTFTRQLSRQVVIAVHERELFDYLKLELSPGDPSDRLVAVDLGDGTVEPEVSVVKWVAEPALAG